MKRMTLMFVSVVAFLALAVAGTPAQDKGVGMNRRPVPQTPEWQKLSSLAGRWQGTIEEGGKTTSSELEVRMTGDGSAIMHILGKDSPEEMVTVFHPDGDRLLATHYCAAHNQPRMALVKPPAANQVAFDYIDGTNIRPGDGHISHVVLTFIDADHHDEAWSGRAGDKETPPAVFHFTRKK